MAFLFGSGGAKIVEGPTHAVQSFGLNGSVYFNNYPIHKFLFAVKINFNPAAGITVDEEDLVLIVKNVQIGGISIDTEEMNEYNRSRLIHSKLRFQNTVVNMHDVADGKAMKLWNQYYKYYFADGRSNFPGFGYDTSLIQDNNRRYAIDDIEIYEFHAGKANRTTLKFPKIVDFQHDTADYELFEGLMQMSFTFKPEYIQYDTGLGVPGFVRRQLQRGGTQEAMSSSVSQFLTFQAQQDQGQLRQDLLDTLQSDTEAATLRRATNTLSNAAPTPETISRLSAGSPVSRASTSVLDSIGRVAASPQRVLPGIQNSNQPTSRSSLRASPQQIDSTSIGNVVDGNEQGGND